MISAFVESQVYFLVRHHGRSPSWREITDCAAQSKGQDSAGNQIEEQEIEVSLPNGSWMRVRRVTVGLPTKTRNGATSIHLLTNLPKRVSAKRVSAAYAERWTIETCLGHLARALNAEINTLCYPSAAELCFCLALTLYNLLSTTKSILQKHCKQPEGQREVTQLSYYYLASEIAQTEAGLRIAIDDAHWCIYEAMPLTKFISHIKSIAHRAELKR